MHTNPHPPVDDETIGRLLGEMRQYRDINGIYAADMLEAARFLLDQPEHYPRQAEAAAYHIRQAVKEIFGDTRDYKEDMSDLVGRVVEAKDDIQTIDRLDEGTLQRLHWVVDELKHRVCDPAPEIHLKERFKKHTGADPEDGLIREYRRILGDSNDLMHHVCEVRTDIRTVRNHYEYVVTVLALIFLPTERLARIERLAELPEPQKPDLDELRRVVGSVYDFNYFVSRMNSSVWLRLMGPDMLKSPSGNSPWLLGYLAEHLKETHVDAFVCMLKRCFTRWVSDDVGLGELGFVGYRLGDVGLPWLFKTLQVSEKARVRYDEKVKVRLQTNKPDPEHIKEIERIGGSIRQLDDYARRVFLQMKQPNSRFFNLAEHLLDSTFVDGYHKTNHIPAKLVESMDLASATHIVEILARELLARLEREPYLSVPNLNTINEPGYDHAFKINGLVANLCEALTKARNLGVPTPSLIETLDRLPKAVRPKFEAWLYSQADDVAASKIVRYVVDACSSRPSGEEDGLLLDRLKRDGRIQDISKQAANLLGKAPDTRKMGGHLLQWGISREERWHILWARTMRPWVELPDEWKPCLDIVDGIHEAERDYGSLQTLEAPETQNDTTLSDRYSIDDPLKVAAEIATKEHSTGGFPELMEEHSTVSDLETMVRDNAPKWLESPTEIIQRLHQPRYVAGYLRGLADAKETHVTHADRIVSAIKFTRTHQWHDGVSGSPTPYHADELGNMNMTGIKLIEVMIKEGVSLNEDSLADVWWIVNEAITVPDPEVVEWTDYSTNYLHTVDSLPHVQAVYTLFEVIRYAKQNGVDVPNTALTKLSKAIRLTGRYGVDYHACIGTRARFMHAVALEWFEQNEQYLFGSAVSAELGRVALDMCLMECQPTAFILERYPDGVFGAVKRGTPMATYHLLNGLLGGVRGYEPERVAKKLLNIGPECVLKVGGWDMFHLLHTGASKEHVRRVVGFWDSVLKHSKPESEALAGFGWWADIPGIDQERWEELMVRTCKMAKKLDWSQRVAERISTSQTITDDGWRILARLFSIDIGNEEGEVAKHAMDALRKTVGVGDTSSQRSHLRTVLMNHGFRDAEKF